MTERKLVERCVSGDREAQRELYAQTSERVYNLLLRMTGNAEDAFDLAQDTYLKAFAQIGQFDGRARLATWLYRIAVNEALQFLRRTRREQARRAGLAIRPGSQGGADQVADRLDVADALDALPPGDRAVLLLRYQHGLDYRALAETLDCSEGTVASRLNRARARIRRILQQGYATREEPAPEGHPTDSGKKVSG